MEKKYGKEAKNHIVKIAMMLKMEFKESDLFLTQELVIMKKIV